jgi:hypothetical protein
MLPILRILFPILGLFVLWKANEGALGDTKPVFFYFVCVVLVDTLPIAGGSGLELSLSLALLLLYIQLL